VREPARLLAAAQPAAADARREVVVGRGRRPAAVPPPFPPFPFGGPKPFRCAPFDAARLGGTGAAPSCGF
jgi:hypothetical protein